MRPLSVLLLLVSVSQASAQDSDEVKKLKEKIDLLEKKLQLAGRENELLRKELDQARGSKGGTLVTQDKKALSARLEVGAILTGTEVFNNGIGGSLTLTVTERDGNKIKASYRFVKKGAQGKVLQADRDLEGEVELNRVTFKSVGKAHTINLSLSLNGDSLNGSVKHSNGNSGKVGVKFGK
jgi:hypothetical protein